MLRVLIACLFPFLAGTVSAAEPAAASSLPDGLYAEIRTPRGLMVAELFFQQAPLTVANFVGLAEGRLGPSPGTPYFNGLTFHRVAPGFVVQGGDPLGTGEGGPGYRFPDEFVPELRHDQVGMLSMANSGMDTNGSQFFITLRPANRLNYLHSVFGRLVRGLDVLPAIEQGDTMEVSILREGKAAEDFAADRAALDRLIAQAPKAIAPHFDDPDDVLPDASRARTYNQKLSSFERFTGVKIYVRLYAGLDPADGEIDAAHQADMLAGQLAGGADAAVAVHVADQNEWALRIPEALRARILAEPAGAQDSEAFVTEARTRAAAAAGGLDSRLLPPPIRARLETDEMVDGLIAALAVSGER